MDPISSRRSFLSQLAVAGSALTLPSLGHARDWSGRDPVRYPDEDIVVLDDKFKAYKNFANKIWNITRFVLSNTENAPSGLPDFISEKDAADLKELDEIIKDVTADMEAYRFYLAAEKLYHYVWHTFADKIIEESKTGAVGPYTLRYILENSLKLLHPFMPFITEEIWSHLPATPDKKLLMVTEWPK